MGMTPDEFAADSIEDPGGRTRAGLLENRDHHSDDKEYVAEFFLDTLGVFLLNGGHRFVALLEEKTLHRVEGLFTIPGTTLGSPQPGDNLVEIGKTGIGRHRNPQYTNMFR